MGSSDTGKALIVIGILLFLVPFFVVPVMMATGSIMSLSPIIFIFPVIGMAFLFVGSALYRGGFDSFGYFHRGARIPPVQYPQQAQFSRERGVVEEIVCPDCGASPRTMRYYGIWTCEYCGTKFKVR
ncbi:MAG: hypothetical protein JSV09_04445 [Thermoplasmata archaeon]|nr:MAG: hypothetical protein JSV09_04445 [Thermoplasmata archaeon]